MSGTSFDTALILDGWPQVLYEGIVDGMPVPDGVVLTAEFLQTLGTPTFRVDEERNQDRDQKQSPKPLWRAETLHKGVADAQL